LELCVDIVDGFESVVLEEFLPNLVPQIFLPVEFRGVWREKM